MTGEISLKDLHAREILRDLDLAVTDMLNRRFAQGGATEDMQLLVALTSRAVGEKHICLPLSKIQNLLIELGFEEELAARRFMDKISALDHLPAQSNGLIGSPDSEAPLIFDGQRVYLRRYWLFQTRVAERLRSMASEIKQEGAVSDRDLNMVELEEEQKTAVVTALTRRLTLISGGPGTGKTFTMAYILRRLMERDPGAVIRMAAPTGKAAMRLMESIKKAWGGDSIPDILSEACTLERLLGYRRGSPYFKHGKDNPLPADVVLIDEASMIDLPKMAKLLDALPLDSRLILMGDMNQLASVAPGSVFGDLCASESLQSSLVRLKKSRRFLSGGEIDRFSRSVLEGRVDLAHDLLQQGGGGKALAWHPSQAFPTDEKGKVKNEFAEAVLRGYQSLTESLDPEQAFQALSSFRVLCATRRGPQGVESVNTLIEEILSGQALPSGELPEDLQNIPRLHPQGEHYCFRVVLVTRNDYELGLFNGDVGILLFDMENDGALKVFFEPQVKGQTFRRIPPSLMPEHETAFAMTVHKSQGSEFDSVLVMLPAKVSPLLSRELLYTGITRTKNKAALFSSEEAFEAAIKNQTQRFSGMGDCLPT